MATADEMRSGFVLCKGDEVVKGPFDEIEAAVARWEGLSLRRRTASGEVVPLTEEEYLAAGRVLHGRDWMPH